MKTLIIKSLAVFALLVGMTNISFALPKCVEPRSINWQNCFGTFTFSGGDKYVGEFKDNKFLYAQKKNKVGKLLKTNSFIKPIDGEISNPFSYDTNGNQGINIKASEGSPVVASNSGTVALVSKGENQPTIIFITHKDNILSAYTNISNVNLQKGDLVKRGQIIGSVAPGKNFLHFEMIKDNQRIDPIQFFEHNDTFANGDKYVGESKDDASHGEGAYTWADGEKYVGEYKDGKMHGQGTYTYASGHQYVGAYKDDESHGQGTFTYANGDKYVGDYKNGNKHGQGTFTWADGDKYVGETRTGWLGIYIQDVPEDIAAARDLDSTDGALVTYTYDGPAKIAGVKVADVIISFDNQLIKNTRALIKIIGATEVGKIVKVIVMRSGEKKVIEVTVGHRGQVKGSLVNDNRRGQGTYTYANGDKYVGEWQDDYQHGQGAYTFDNGEKYVGKYKYRKKDGLWEYFTKDGSLVRTETWENGVKQFIFYN